MSFYDKIQENVRNSFNVRDELKQMTEPELFNLAQMDRLDFAVCTLNVEGDLNVGMILRSAHLLGARECVIFGRRRFDRRSLVGADKYLEIRSVQGLIVVGDDVGIDPDAFLTWIASTNYTPIYIEHGGMNLTELPTTLRRITQNHKTPLFVFGNEGTGIPTQLLTQHDAVIVSVPQRGVLRSYNVAATAAMVMWEAVRSW